MSQTFNHGLSDSQLRKMKNILSGYASLVTSVAVFGSRATGTYKSNSDIDLVLYGDIDSAGVDRLWTLFQESSLPYKVDVSAYNLIRYKPIKRHIDNVGRVLFTSGELEN